MTSVLSFLITLFLLIESLPLVWLPTLTVDAADKGADVSTYATGFLYGLAEEGVPSQAMTNSLDISSVSQKVIGGLQHPIGDIDNVSSQLDECDYRVVYLQDAFDTWYYCHEEINAMRDAGTYSWESFLEERYLPIVEEKVRELSQKSYSDSLVYCIYNECDNGVWFGDYSLEENRQNFYEGWKITYDLVKSVDPDAKIGGPGFCDYETQKMEGFMTFCAENDCLPDIIIYHELAYWSIPDWNYHVEDYRRIEKELSIEQELPIIVTEYGTMEDCGNPSTMIHYIMAMERTGVYGNMAYWRLANNLNDTAADDNSPNSNWWLYRKYKEMEGALLKTSSKSADKYNYRDRLDALAALTPDGKKIDMLIPGSDSRFAVKIKNLDETNLGKKVDVKIECVYYKGLTGIVSEPILLRQMTMNVSLCGNLNINVPATDENAVYFLTVTPHDESTEPVRNTNIPVRYEFEDGKLLGSAYTYDSAYSTSGSQQGMCGGFENDGDGVKLEIKAESEGYYNLDIIYGKHNDSGIPQQRDFGQANIKIDSDQGVLYLENTIKSEYTTCKTLSVYLTKGKHTIEISHMNGTFVLDSLIMTKDDSDGKIAILNDSEDDSAFLAVAPYDAYYRIKTNKASDFTVDGAKAETDSESLVYLRRGLNEIVFAEKEIVCEIAEFSEDEADVFTKSFTADMLTLEDGAKLSKDKYGNLFVEGISSEAGKASFTVCAEESGDYRVTLFYSNNAEGGVHSYNVDLIESYVTVSANGESKDVYCRNTYSKYTYRSVTFNLTLNEGENEITLSNSGSTLFNSQTAVAPQIKLITVNSAD